MTPPLPNGISSQLQDTLQQSATNVSWDMIGVLAFKDPRLARRYITVRLEKQIEKSTLKVLRVFIHLFKKTEEQIHPFYPQFLPLLDKTQIKRFVGSFVLREAKRLVKVLSDSQIRTLEVCNDRNCPLAHQTASQKRRKKA